MFTHISESFSMKEFMPIVSFALNYLVATEYKASFGHLSNQSIVQQLIIEGNCLHLFLSF
jgi:hypothetical protein